MVDLVDRAQALEEIQREEALQRVLDRARRPQAPQEPTHPPEQAERDDS